MITVHSLCLLVSKITWKLWQITDSVLRNVGDLGYLPYFILIHGETGISSEIIKILHRPFCVEGIRKYGLSYVRQCNNFISILSQVCAADLDNSILFGGSLSCRKNNFVAFRNNAVMGVLCYVIIFCLPTSSAPSEISYL